MGIDDILKDIIAGGEVPQTELNVKHRCHGPLSRQLRRLRDMGLVGRKLVDGQDTLGRLCKQWVYFPMSEAIELYKKKVAK